jgi:hypothetical protein
MRHKWIQAACLIFLVWSSSVFAVAMPIGSWIGWMKFDGQQAKYAVKLETLNYQPNELDHSPVFQMHFRIGLGGLTSPEYFSQFFEKVNYNFDTQSVTLDTAENDLILTGRVEKISSLTLFRGNVFSRSSAVSGSVVLKFLSDEPDDEPNLAAVDAASDDPDNDPAPFAQTLSGQYEGLCGIERAIIQLETARGLGETPDSLFPGLAGYTVSGRLGFDLPRECALPGIHIPSGRDWCTFESYASAQYNIANGFLTLNGGQHSQSCRLLDGQILCSGIFRPVGSSTPTSCVFNRIPSGVSAPARPFYRQFSVPTTADQRQALPEMLPPANTDLVAALDGMYSGYLHHEGNNLYQPMGLKVVASVSTENPHNLNMVYISGAAIFHFDSPTSTQAPIWSQRFERKAFYINNGFVLDDHNSDTFIKIDLWKKGMITGVLYSRQFGRVGTIQFVKSAMPAIDARAKFVANPLGSFLGPVPVGPREASWWLRVTPQIQTASLGQSTFSFQGQLGTNNGIVPRRPMEVGAYDFYTQATGFLIGSSDGPRMYSGHVFDWGLSLFWLGAPRFQVLIPGSHEELPYKRQPY